MLKKIFCALCVLVLSASALAEVSLIDQWDSIAHIPGTEELLLVRRDGKWGVIARDGEVLIEPAFKSEPEFKDGYAIVQRTTLNPVEDMSSHEDYIPMCGVLDITGRLIVPMEYNSIELSTEEGVILVEKDGFYGYMNLQGEFFIEPEYARAHMFIGEYAAVGREDTSGQKDACGLYQVAWGMIDRSGREVIPLGYDTLYVGDNGIAVACLNGKYGYVNAKNETIVDFKYYNAEPFANGYAAVATKQDVRQTNVSEPFDVYWGAIDENGREVIPCEYASLTMGDNGIALVRESYDGGYGYINMKNEYIVKPTLYRAEPFVGEYAAVGRMYRENAAGKYTDVRWGVIDSEGNEVLPMEYTHVEICADGTLKGYSNGNEEIFRMESNADMKIAK